MIIINFGHPITPEQIFRIEALSQQKTEQVINLNSSFSLQESFSVQLDRMVNSVPLSPEEWQTLPILINLPSLNYIAAMLLADLHGRMGYFPPVIRFSPVEGSVPVRFEAAEILNLQMIRSNSRERR